ncbi:MAG: hypothetical protein ACE5E5_08020 [Phycisphaerae bacterium]
MNANHTLFTFVRATSALGRKPSPLLLLISVAMGALPTTALGLEDSAQQRDRRPDPRFGEEPPRFDRRNQGNPDREPLGAPPALWRRMTLGERERVMDFIRENLPELAEHFSRGPGAFKPWMRRHIGEIVEMMEMMERDPERGELMIHERRLDMQMNRLARAYATSREPDVRARVEKEMTRACAEWVDLRHRRREIQIQELEQRLEALRKRHERASEMREQRIEIEVARRLERAEGPINAIPKRD